MQVFAKHGIECPVDEAVEAAMKAYPKQAGALCAQWDAYGAKCAAPTVNHGDMRVRQPGDHLFLPSALDRHRADLRILYPCRLRIFSLGKTARSRSSTSSSPWYNGRRWMWPTASASQSSRRCGGSTSSSTWRCTTSRCWRTRTDQRRRTTRGTTTSRCARLCHA